MKLSLVCRGKNDQYGGPDYITRTKYCLNSHIQNFLSLGLTPTDVEIIFVDWGSDVSIIPLLLQEAHGFLRYITVPHAITKLYDPPVTKFDFVRSVNTGIARSKGDFIMHIDPDVFTDAVSTKRILDHLGQPGANRYQYYFTRFTINPIYLNDPYRHVIPSVRPDIDSVEKFNGYSTAVIASKQAWSEVGGYDERFTRWGGQDSDLFIRFYMAGYTAKDLHITNGVQLVHIDHEHKQSEPNPYNCRKPDKGIVPNGSNWGLQNIQFLEIIV